MKNPAYGTLLLRLGLGGVFLAHALLKLVVFGLPGTAQFFGSVGFPAATAYVVFAAELVGGTLLVLGIASRWVALGLVPVMLGALTVHWGNGFWFNATNGGWEFPAFLVVALLALFLQEDDGALALARWLRRRSPSSPVPVAVRVARG